ncbi:MAG: hypothetical protein ACE5JX_08045 [Acidobacteriota bacterium]
MSKRCCESGSAIDIMCIPPAIGIRDDSDTRIAIPIKTRQAHPWPVGGVLSIGAALGSDFR